MHPWENFNMSSPDQSGERLTARKLRLPGIVFLLIALCIVVYGVMSRSAQGSRLKDLTEEQAVPNVAVVSPSKVANQTGFDLPGRLEAFIQAPIYARVPGYLKNWKHDIGSKVKAGDLLAEIDTPDIDQQLLQARAALAASQANAKLSEITAKRWQSLSETDAVSKQDVDQRTFTYDANMAQVKAAKANVDRLVAEEGFKRLTAPFDGVVTARETDIGQLINVGATGGVELFVVSEIAKLRVYVNVPQNYVPNVPAGTKAIIHVPEHPDKTFYGTVEASSGAVVPSSGTTLMQIVVDNAAGELMPGSYASIRLQSASVANALSVPSSALIFDAKGLSIATVDANNHVQLKSVTLNRDLGSVVEIATGLTASDRVIDSPPDGVANGDVVHLIGKPADKPPAAAGAPPATQANHG
jgi:RND family efflux transporter MFP subunit